MAKLVALAPEREIFLRTGGRVRFLHISTRLQLVAVGSVGLLLAVWALATGAMLWSQTHLEVQQAALAKARASVSSREAQVAAARHSAGDIAREIEQRQRALEAMMRDSLGAAMPAGSGDGTPAGAKSGKTSAATPDAGLFERLRDRQHQIETQLASAAQKRLARVETAIRAFGLNPAAAPRGRQRLAQGGPYEPANGLIAQDAGLRDIALLLGRLNAMEDMLAAIPSGRPTQAPMETSSYGYRRDPFNGQTAFHSGIDFPGSYGQPIVAAAGGRVSFVGQRPGYGNVIEIEHGNAIMTRYAHLSRFGAHVGEKVDRGQTIARMGSTGRSTGTHLHFEVRVHGDAVNPRRFLEARQDVLEVQQLTQARPEGRAKGRIAERHRG